MSRKSLLTPLRPSRPLWLARIVEHFGKRLACPLHDHRNGKGVEIAQRLFCGRPLCALMPMLVATLWPLRIAQSELEPPRWQEMIRRSLRPEQFGRPRGDVAMAGAVKSQAAHQRLLPPNRRERRNSDGGRG